VASSLKKAKVALLEKGYHIRLLDCYRPAPAQQKLWNIKPDKRYVAPPEKGSMHGRGLAVDMTLDSLGVELDMGTPFDYFGRSAWPTIPFPDPVIQYRRTILADAMKAQGFRQARSEWWHFSKNNSRVLYDWQWECGNEE